MTRNRTRIRALFGIAVLGAAFAAPAVTAADTFDVYSLDVGSCTVTDPNGDPVDPSAIPAGSEVTLFEGWIANTHGQLVSFLNNAKWVLTVDDEPIDVTPLLSGPINFGPFWADLFGTDPMTIAAGQTIHTHYDNVLKSANFDGEFHWAKGSVYGGGVDCSFTGV